MCSISAHSAIITPAASGSVTMQRDCHNRSSLTVHSIVIDSKTEMIAQVQHGCDISQQRVRLPWRQCPFCCPLFTHACILLHMHASCYTCLHHVTHTCMHTSDESHKTTTGSSIHPENLCQQPLQLYVTKSVWIL